MTMETLLIVLAAFILGAAAAWLAARTRITGLRTELRMTREAADEKVRALEAARGTLGDTFKALSADALRASTAQFLEMAKLELGRMQSEARSELEKRQEAVANLVGPIRESLAKVQDDIRQLEKAREGAYRDLLGHMRQLADSHVRLENQTSRLATALRDPRVGGFWGEIQLRRIVELSGMKDNYDFVEQKAVTEEDKRYIPDLVVNLPGDRAIVVDAKVSTEAYLQALEAASDAEREARLDDFLRHIQGHIATLKSKEYWKAVPNTTEFVVMFLPGENFLYTALNRDPALIEKAAASNVILATPTTLISLFKAVAYGWRQEEVARNALLIREAGEKLYRRVGTFLRHFDGIRGGLERAAEAYNKAVGSLEARVLPAAREMTSLGVGGDGELESPSKTEKSARAVTAPEREDTSEDS